MTAAKQQEIIDWAINRLQSYDKEKKLYNITAIILSFLDVACGIATIFYAGMLATSIVASILCGTVWGARFIQLVKMEKLAQALKTLKVSTALSLSYILVRKKRREFMKNTKIRNYVIAGLTILGFAAVIVCHFVPALREYIDYAIYYMCALLPADLYAVFNNAKMTAEEVQEKAEAKKIKEAEAKAREELKEKQANELKALTERKLAEAKAKAEEEARKAEEAKTAEQK